MAASQIAFNGGDLQAYDSTAEKKKAEEALGRMQPGMGLRVRGFCQIDTYDNTLTVMARDINAFELPRRKDHEKHKRIELHAHTHMSYMDGLVSAGDLITQAAAFGHKAIAITDTAVVQAFPEAFSAAKKQKIKLIPGMEGIMMDDTGIVHRADTRDINRPIIVLDFETTGLNPFADRIIEIGAVKLEHNTVVDSFSTLVNPEIPLSDKVIQITGIQDFMLKDQPKAAQALPRLMDFIADCPIAAHNAGFDMAFLRGELGRLGKEVELPEIDTLAFSQKLYPDLKRYNLASLCKYLGVTLRNAHRAVHDATATAQCLAIMLEEAKTKGAQTLQDINDLIIGYNRNNRHHITLLVAHQQGMTNINRLVSMSHMQYFFHEPLIPRDQLVKHREGLLVGSGCIEGELYQAVLNNKNDEELEKIAAFYDFIEVQPESNYEPLVRQGRITNQDTLREMNQALIRLGDRLGKPVVATGNVHFLNKEDAIYRAIIKNSLPIEKENSDDQPPLYFRTTSEMLDEFVWLGEEKARELVIDNPAKVAAMIEPVSLYPAHPEQKTTFSPVWENAADEISQICEQNARKFYGDPLPAIVRARLDKELKAIIGYGYATLYSIAQKLVRQSLDDGYPVGSRGSVGSSFVATMCGITEVNPLPPHYRCANCHLADFDIPEGIQTGPDLPARDCPQCGGAMIKDGYDIPFEVFLGFKGDKVPDIDLNFCSEYQSKAHAHVEKLFGQGYVFRAGTIGTLQEKTAFGFVLKYLEDRDMRVSQAEKTRLAQGCIGVKRTTGQHPGGMVILPKEYEINQFTAIQRPANDQDKDAITTHYDFGSMHDVLVKVDVLGHDDPTMIRRMEELSDIHWQDIPLDDPQVLSLFRSPEALGLSRETLGWSTGTLGIPEFGTVFVRGILEDTQPTTMADLVRISGLSHGKEVWAGNSRELILDGTATLSDCICTREDIMNALMSKGLDSKMAFDIMENVRKGRGLTPVMEQAMHNHDVEDWFIKSCWKIAYMFPKGHAVAYVTMALRVGWFKVHKPLVYYAAYFSIRGKGFNALTMTRPVEYIKQDLQALYDLPQRDRSDKSENEITALELVHEMGLRGYRFLPVDLYKSDTTQFLIEGEALRCPFTSLSGFGEGAALGILETREGGYISIEDLKNKAKLSSSAIELLRECGALNGLNDTNQVDFFSLLT
ncbi:MAG: PolC-type DNA polymerase III [Christensenellales bacterium]